MLKDPTYSLNFETNKETNKNNNSKKYSNANIKSSTSSLDKKIIFENYNDDILSISNKNKNKNENDNNINGNNYDKIKVTGRKRRGENVKKSTNKKSKKSKKGWYNYI